MDKKKEKYLGQDIQAEVLFLSQYPNEVLAAALLFYIANSLTIEDIDPEEEVSGEEFNKIIGMAGEEALSLAEQINILYNTQGVTKH